MADGRGPMGQYRLGQFWSMATFCIKVTQNYFAFQIQYEQKNSLAHIWPVGGHVFEENGLLHGALIT